MREEWEGWRDAGAGKLRCGPTPLPSRFAPDCPDAGLEGKTVPAGDRLAEINYLTARRGRDVRACASTSTPAATRSAIKFSASLVTLIDGWRGVLLSSVFVSMIHTTPGAMPHV